MEAILAHESRGLGRGLGALLNATPKASASRGGGTLPLGLMQAGGFQPRRSILQQPLLGGAVGAARYEIVAGERRWQAAKLAGLADIPVIVRELTDSQSVAVALIENIQREELTPAEEARALQRV